MRSRDDFGGGENDDARKRGESLQSIALVLEEMGKLAYAMSKYSLSIREEKTTRMDTDTCRWESVEVLF